MVHGLGCLDSAGNVTVVYITVPEVLPEPGTFLFPLNFGLDTKVAFDLVVLSAIH